MNSVLGTKMQYCFLGKMHLYCQNNTELQLNNLVPLGFVTKKKIKIRKWVSTCSYNLSQTTF